MAERLPIERGLQVVPKPRLGEITVLPVKQPIFEQATLPGINPGSTSYLEGGMGRLIEGALLHGQTIVTRAELSGARAQDVPHQLRDALGRDGVHEAKITNTGLTKLVSRDLGGNIVNTTNWT